MAAIKVSLRKLCHDKIKNKGKLVVSGSKLADRFPKDENHINELLSSSDWHDVSIGLTHVLDVSLTELADQTEPSDTFFGLSGSAVVTLDRQMQNAAVRQDRLADTIEAFDDLTANEISALAHLENIRGQLRRSAHIMAERNTANHHEGEETFSRESRRQRMTNIIQSMQKRGWSREDILEFFSNVRVWLTATPHPTLDMNEEGTKLLVDLTTMAEQTPSAKRQSSAEQIIGQMIETPMTPRKKADLSDENQKGLNDKKVYNEGLVDYLEDLQGALDNVFVDEPIDLLSDDMFLDAAMRDWYAGDADGKQVPATELFAKRLESGRMSIKLHIRRLHRISPVDKEKFAIILEAFESFDKRLDALNADYQKFLKKMRKKTIDKFTDADRKKLQNYKDEFVKAFTKTSYKDQSYDLGPNLTEQIMSDLASLSRDTTINPQSRSQAFRIAINHKQNGMSMGRQEIRHNSRDLDAILENLYAYLHKNHPDVLQKCFGKTTPVEKLTDLADQPKARLMHILMENHGADMQDWFLKANPKGWSREILERFSVIRDCFNHNRLGIGIIAESEAISPVYQQVLAQSFGIKKMVHVPLNEDEQTITNAAENFDIYQKVHGQRNAKIQTTESNGKPVHFCIMDPQSDSQKQNGWPIKGEQRESQRKIMDLALSIGQAIYHKLGTGMSYARGGRSPKDIPRMFFHVVSTMEQYNSGEFTPDEIKILKQMACFISTTIQGRDPSIRLGTPAQVYDMLFGIIEEAAAVCLALDGNLGLDGPSIIGTEAKIYDDVFAEIIDDIALDAREKYQRMRGLQSSNHLGRKRLDVYAEEVGALHVVKHSNTGARKDKRPGGANEKGLKGYLAAMFQKNATKNLAPESNIPPTQDVTGGRAIYSNKSIKSTEALFDGAYTLGEFLTKLWEGYKSGHILKQDLKLLWDDKFYFELKFPNIFVSLAHANYEHGFDVLEGNPKERWSVEKVREAMRRQPECKGMSENLAFHTVLTDDALKATALIEALGNTATGSKDAPNFDADSIDDMIEGLYDKDDHLNKLKFGPKTMERYPHIEANQIKAKADQLIRAAVHAVNDRVKSGTLDTDDPQMKQSLFHIANARESKGPENMEVLLDEAGFGHRPNREHVFDLIAQLDSDDPAPDPKAEHAAA